MLGSGTKRARQLGTVTAAAWLRTLAPFAASRSHQEASRAAPRCLSLPSVAAPESRLRFSPGFSLQPGCVKMSLDSGCVSGAAGEAQSSKPVVPMCAQAACTHVAWTGREVRGGRCCASERSRRAFSPGFTVVNEDENIGSDLNYISVPSPKLTVYLQIGQVHRITAW